MRIFKQAVHLTKKAARIRAELSDINPFNAGKKKEAALELLHKWFPAMEDFETEVNKYKDTIDLLAANNTELEKQVIEADNGRFDRNLENATLKSQMLELKKFINSIPPDLRKQLKAEQRQRQARQRERGDR